MSEKVRGTGIQRLNRRRNRSRAQAAARLVLLLAAGLLSAPAALAVVDTDPLNHDPLVREAFQHFYILDYDGALSRFQQVKSEHPSDPIATDYVLDCILFRELYRLDLLDTTFYANDGFLSGKHSPSEDDPKVRDEVNTLADQAVGQAEVELKVNKDDVNALFARGWARSLKAVYLGMIERSFVSGLHLAVQARSDHDRVLELDPNYVDAKMVVGIHQYVVGSLPFAFKILAGLTGNSGSKEKGLAMLKDSGERGVITSVESRTSMALFLRREARYNDAIVIARGLAQQYPRDFLFLLEEANLMKDAGQGPQAIAAYERLLDMAKRPGYFYNPHLELAWFGLGDTLRGQRSDMEAVNAFQQAAAQPTISPELKRRCLLEAGEIYDTLHRHDDARREYQAVLATGTDTPQADQARKYMRSPYAGK